MVAFWKDGAGAEVLEEPPAEHLRNARQLVQLMTLDARAEGNHGGRMTLEALEIRLRKAGEQADAMGELARTVARVQLADVGLLERAADRSKRASAADAARLEELAALLGALRLWRDAVAPFWKVAP